jgi:hypothetical protein
MQINPINHAEHEVRFWNSECKVRIFPTLCSGPFRGRIFAITEFGEKISPQSARSKIIFTAEAQSSRSWERKRDLTTKVTRHYSPVFHGASSRKNYSPQRHGGRREKRFTTKVTKSTKFKSINIRTLRVLRALRGAFFGLRKNGVRSPLLLLLSIICYVGAPTHP